MNVLSLFDGMSCGQIALERAGIEYDWYFASEIDKYAIKVAMSNYPYTTQLGNVNNIKANRLPKIDLLIGGSPCQGFSFAGKHLNFNDSRSKLFFQFVRLLDECNPTYFLLENVRMKKEYQDVITEYLEVEPVEINSALVSAQNRRRLYWTNIPITQSTDKKIYLKDIIQHGVTERNKSLCIDAHYYNGANMNYYLTKKRRQLIFNKPFRIQTLGNGNQGNRVYAIEGKSITLAASSGGLGSNTGLYYINNCYRKLTPVECERLQTVPDNYTNHVSNTQRYKMLGNGWTVDVIAHIFKGIKDIYTNINDLF